MSEDLRGLMLKDYQLKLLELLEQLELEISNLYKLFAEKFPCYHELWNDLSDEEFKHATHIKKLATLAKEGKIHFDEKMTKTFTVQAVINDIKTKYQKTKDNQYPLINALSFSHSLEQSIIEHKFYDFFSSSDADIMLIINSIKEDTTSHSSIVKKALDEETNR